mgnify:CR=1 FL=1
MSLDDRKLEVLRAIVEDYVATQEPVGSKTLVERHQLGVSPATVRNDMAVLEEEGFITQPHTSAGRIPTDKGYRLFVDRLSGVKPLSAAEKRAIAVANAERLVKELEVRLGAASVTLNSFIVSNTSFHALTSLWGEKSKEEISDSHILFQKDEGYVQQMLEMMTNVQLKNA